MARKRRSERQLAKHNTKKLINLRCAIGAVSNCASMLTTRTKPAPIDLMVSHALSRLMLRSFMSREEIISLLQYCHWISARRGIGSAERHLVSELSRAGAFKRSRNHFSGLELKMHLQTAQRQSDGSWLLLFNNGQRTWKHSCSPCVRV